jgi:hypothetical protein
MNNKFKGGSITDYGYPVKHWEIIDIQNNARKQKYYCFLKQAYFDNKDNGCGCTNLE